MSASGPLVDKLDREGPSLSFPKQTQQFEIGGRYRSASRGASASGIPRKTRAVPDLFEA
jgi:hypothetical protein